LSGDDGRVGVIVVIPGYEDDWFGSRWAYGLIVDRASRALSDPDDRLALEVGGYRQGLFLAWTSPAQARRLARALAPAADAVARELRENPEKPRDLEEAETLEELERRLVATYVEPDPRGRLLWLSRALGLQADAQDWAIVNANADRMDEFIRFLDETELRPVEVVEMVGLILASANERLLRDPRAPLDSVDPVLRDSSEGAIHVEYWRSLDDAERFPIGAWLRARVPTHD
jgi:hypothetical protein